jgi:hypothetical protein
LLSLVGGEESYIQLYNRTEYRIVWLKHWAPSRAASAPPQELAPPADGRTDAFDTIFNDLSAELKKSRRWDSA